MIDKLSFLFVFFAIMHQGCPQSPSSPEASEVVAPEAPPAPSAPLLVGAERMQAYLPALLGAEGVGLVVNQSSRVGERHLVDTLLAAGVKLKQIFAPEHGFRGEADAGETIADGKDIQTGLPIVSLYGSNKKPRPDQLASLDIVVFDVQDVGVRFYTYISTMHYVMEACAENDVFFLLLDRPNPNGHYVDGPVLDTAFRSFVGMHPVPVVHGMTVGEYAQMVNGEGWLSLPAEMEVITCENYTHDTPYELPVRPSPNLPNARSVYLYPSLCFFEGTTVSLGRGTNKQFQIYGHPESTVGDYTFTPVPMPGAKQPKHEGKACRGYSLSEVPADSIRRQARLELSYLIDFYQAFPKPEAFFLKNNFFGKLAGTDRLRKQILAGQSAEEIRASWAAELADFQAVREKYLIYE